MKKCTPLAFAAVLTNHCYFCGLVLQTSRHIVKQFRAFCQASGHSLVTEKSVTRKVSVTTKCYVHERSATHTLVHISPVSASKNRTLTYIDDTSYAHICHLTEFYDFIYL